MPIIKWPGAMRNVVIWLGAVAITVSSATLAANIRVIATCDFEGPYSAGAQQIQEGCVNNWQWGRKDMVLRADRQSGRPGTTQRICVRGIASGGMQFFFTRLALRKNYFYRISYWMKTEGLEGPIRCYVRKIGYPWTVYIPGGYVPIVTKWQRFSFVGQAPEEVSSDVGVCWEGGSLGTIWLDDLCVEESEAPFAMAEQSPPLSAPKGNLFPRSSFEGRRDRLWTMIFFGGQRAGVWEGVEGDWEDPQPYRAEGGRFGRYCLALPNAKHLGQAAAVSTLFQLLPGKPYTVSAWLKGDPEGLSASLALLYWGGRRHLQALKGAAYTKLTREWQRVSFTTTPEPAPDSLDPKAPVSVLMQIAPPPAPPGVVYVDGVQLEQAEAPTAYRPAYPLELYADVRQKSGHLFHWGQVVPLNIMLAAAAKPTIKQATVEIVVRGYPDQIVWRDRRTMPVDTEKRLLLALRRRGLFRADIRCVQSGLAAPQQLIFAIVPPPRETGREGMFGTHIALRPALVHYVRQLGFTWTRLHDCSLLTKWSANEPEPGRLLWHDEVVEGVRRGGLHLLGLPDQAPEWARHKEPGAYPFNTEAFSRYCEALARHYAGRIEDWEIWNEPYMAEFFRGGVNHFSEVLLAGAEGIKRGNPHARVVGWCADISNPTWGAGLSRQAREAIDIFSFHFYPNGLGGGGTLPFALELDEHRQWWPAHVQECWNTEGTNGALTTNSFYFDLPGVTREKNTWAMAFASRVWLEHARRGIAKFFVYQMHNTDTLFYHGGYQSLLIGYDRTPTPAAVATATTAYCIDGLTSVPEKPVLGIVQRLFTGRDRRVWAVYDDGGVPGRRTLNLSALPAQAIVLDVMGNDPRREGRRRWEIGLLPLFVMSERMAAKELEAACQAALVAVR